MENTRATAKPTNGKNSIESAAFGLTFNRIVEQHEVEKLLALESILAIELPVFTRLAGVDVQIETNQVLSQTLQVSGVSLQKLAESPGKIAWNLQVTGNGMQVTCGEYDRWNTVLPLALKFFRAALNLLELDSLMITSVGCQVIDRFVYDVPPNPFDLKDIFRTESELVPRSIATAGSLWHCNQGWFSDHSSAISSKTLNQLNLASARINEKLTVTVDHITHIIFETPLASRSMMFPTSGAAAIVDSQFEQIHDANKDVLRRLLTAEKLTAIGM